MQEPTYIHHLPTEHLPRGGGLAGVVPQDHLDLSEIARKLKADKQPQITALTHSWWSFNVTGGSLFSAPITQEWQASGTTLQRGHRGRTTARNSSRPTGLPLGWGHLATTYRRPYLATRVQPEPALLDNKPRIVYHSASERRHGV